MISVFLPIHHFFFNFFFLFFNILTHADMHIWPLASAVLAAGRRCFSKNPSTPAGNPGAKAAKTASTVETSGLFRVETVHQSSLFIYMH